MRVILATEYYYPISRGGTEMYVHQLAKQLIANGHECLIVSLSNELRKAEYESIPIKYIPFEENSFNDPEQPCNLDNLINIVSEYSPDIFHLHTYTPSMGVKHLLKVKELGIKVFFTAHLPNFTCLRGDLMRFGTEVCDGFISHSRCMNCYLHSTGITNEISRKLLFLASCVKFFRKAISRLNQYQNKINTLNIFKNNINDIIVVSHWQKDILKLNGFDEKLINVCRQSIDEDYILKSKKSIVINKIRIGFVGRIVKAKGLHILLDILSQIDNSKFELKIAGIKSMNEVEYYNYMKKNANELGANWQENLDSKDIFNFLDNIDLLVIPSIILETGPYVAFEALARKVPVLAFNYGGVKEIINHSNGFLVENTIVMKETLSKIINNNISELMSIDSNHVRNSNDLFLETISIYTSH